MIVGYARVSTYGQTLHAQQAALAAGGRRAGLRREGQRRGDRPPPRMGHDHPPTLTSSNSIARTKSDEPSVSLPHPTRRCGLVMLR
jgi:hypothetical protein